MQHLSTTPAASQLTHLEVSFNHFTGVGLRCLTRFTQVEDLNVRYCEQVQSDDDFVCLGELRRLRRLKVGSTSFGIAALRSVVAGCSWIRFVDALGTLDGKKDEVDTLTQQRPGLVVIIGKRKIGKRK